MNAPARPFGEIRPARSAASTRSFASLAQLFVRADLLGAAILAVLASLVVGAVVAVGGWGSAQREEVFDAGLAAAAPTDREVRLRSASRVEPSAVDPIGSISRLVDDRAAALDPSITDVLAAPEVVIDTNRFAVLELDGRPPASRTLVTFRLHEGHDDRSTLVAGRRAQPVTEPVADEASLELELSLESAAALDVEIGSTLFVEVSFDDALGRRYQSLPAPFRVEVVGIIELSPIDDPVWFDDGRLHRPVLVDTPIGADRLVTGAISPEAVATAPFLGVGGSPFAAEWRTRVEVERMEPELVPTLRAQLRTLLATTSRTALDEEVSVNTNIGAVVDDVDDSLSAVDELLRSSTWLVAVLLGTVFAVVSSVRSRRSLRALAVARRRGSSALVTASAAGASTAVIISLGSVVGMALGAAAAPAVDGGTAILPGVGAAVIGSVVSGVFAARATASAIGGVEREGRTGLGVLRPGSAPRGWPIARRITTGVIAVALAVAGAAVANESAAGWGVVVTLVAIGPPMLVAHLALRRRSPDHVWLALAASAAVVATGTVLGVLDVVGSPSLDRVDSATGRAVVGAACVAAVTVGIAIAVRPAGHAVIGVEPSPPTAWTPGGAEAVACVVGVVVGVVWLAILPSVFLDHVDLPPAFDVGAPDPVIAAVAIGAALVPGLLGWLAGVTLRSAVPS